MNDALWIQRDLTFPGDGPEERERRAVAHLTEVLASIEERRLITGWWFVRKGAWKVRYRLVEPIAEISNDPVHPVLTAGLEWNHDIYEPETHAFGGPESMELAHELFQQDSRYLLPYLVSDPSERREHSLILCTALMRAAGLDVNEQGDVWARVAGHRVAAATGSVPLETWAAFTKDVGHLLRGSARADVLDPGWLVAFTNAGSALKSLRGQGILTCGMRAIVALHIIFHWNRLGLRATVQADLARAAKEAILGRAQDNDTPPRWADC